MSLGTLFCPPRGAQDMDLFGGYQSSYDIREEHWVNSEGTQDIQTLRSWTRCSGNSEVCVLDSMCLGSPLAQPLTGLVRGTDCEPQCFQLQMRTLPCLENEINWLLRWRALCGKLWSVLTYQNNKNKITDKVRKYFVMPHLAQSHTVLRCITTWIFGRSSHILCLNLLLSGRTIAQSLFLQLFHDICALQQGPAVSGVAGNSGTEKLDALLTGFLKQNHFCSVPMASHIPECVSVPCVC